MNNTTETMPTPWDVLRKGKDRKKFPALTGEFKSAKRKPDARKNNPGQKRFK